MRSSGQMDGMYFFLLFIPFALSIWAGDLLRRKIIHHLLADRFWSQNLSAFIGVSVQILVVTFGVLTGFFLAKLI